ncbi:IS66 family transposase [Candidatus Peregrinibacteria bacterium]|jgi:transposase|nr:IS66 family transposase [Candidatus Peregrinibacteria bacterium]
MAQLTQTEIDRRMQEWRNIKVLHKNQQVTIEKFKLKTKELEAQVAIIPHLLTQIEDLKLQVEELKQIIFGKAKKDDKPDANFSNLKHSKDKKEKKKREKSSYKRALPEAHEITEIKTHTIDKCKHCSAPLTKKKIITFYEEDIPLPDKENKKQIKICIEHKVEKGWCKRCKHWHTSIPLPSSKVVIGHQVKLYICYLSILLRISYPQIISLLRDAYGFDISNGEVANILDKMGQKLKPEFERIKKRLQNGKGVHLDETGWRKLYLWVMASIETEDVLYLSGRNRGNGNIDDLIGHNFDKIRISDGYAAYKNKPGIAQQCWAHPHRKVKDLAKSKALSKVKLNHCQKAYEEFSFIYKELRDFIKEPYDKEIRREQKQNLLKQIRAWSRPHINDPKKLKNIKLQFVKSENEWFTCMDHEGVPCDNNKAERMIRPMVIKRKISFGTKTKRTSDNFSVIASVFMTYWKKYEGSFFSQMFQLI